MEFNGITLLAMLAVAAGLFFTVVPVLPGSLIALLGLLVWAIAEGNTVGWIVFSVCALLLAAGASMQYVLTGRSLKRNRIPSASVIVGLVAGVVGMFFIPVAGLPLGFALGLFGMELVRQKDAGLALRSSVEALKATGLGILAELGLASAAAILFFGALVFSSSV